MQSEMTDKLVTALSKAQGSFESVKKDRTAKAGSYEYHYADLAQVLDAVRKALSENGLALVQATNFTEGGAFVLESRLMHTSGQWVAASWPLPVQANSQQLGSALTYARRYTASALLGIAAEEDDDGAGATEVKTTTQRKTAAKGNGKAEPPKGGDKPQPKIVLTWVDGKTREFPQTVGGALEALAALEAACNANPEHWQPNRELMRSLVEKVPHAQADGVQGTFKERVMALKVAMEGDPEAGEANLLEAG